MGGKWCYDLAKWKILNARCDFALTFNDINMVEDIQNKTSSAGKESICSAGDPVWFLGQEDSLEKG